MLPPLLYHGSRFNVKELKPGLLQTGKLKTWEGTESNRYLYAGTDEKLAIMMAAAAEAEAAGAIEIHTTDNSFTALWERAKPCNVLHHTIIYLYSITPLFDDNWIKVNNDNNPDVDEYKTKTIISDKRFTKEMFRWKEWCEANNITVTLDFVDKMIKSHQW